YLSMRGLIQLQNTLSMIRENLNPDVEIEGILPTLVDTRTVHAKEAIELLEENFGDRVFASRITKTVRFAEAPVKGMSVLKYQPEPELRPAPPSARKQHPTHEEAEERRERRAARTPEQRLREVFSTDIPENIMELSPSEPSAPRYGREEPRVATDPRPVLQPVL